MTFCLAMEQNTLVTAGTHFNSLPNNMACDVDSLEKKCVTLCHNICDQRSYSYVRGKTMFFVRGLTSNQKEILINPEQVLYARKAGHRKSILVLASGSELVLDQDAHSVELLFDEYFHGFIDASSSSSVLAGLRFATDATSGVRGESGSDRAPSRGPARSVPRRARQTKGKSERTTTVMRPSE
jgi:uncharacterized protein YuzB (UPF0349 family)